MAGILFVLVAHTRRGSQCSEYCRCNRNNQLRNKLNRLSLCHNLPPFLITVRGMIGIRIDHRRRIVVVIIVATVGTAGL